MKTNLINTFAKTILIMFLYITLGIGNETTPENSDNVPAILSVTTMNYQNQTEDTSPIGKNGTNQIDCMGCVDIFNNGTSCFCKTNTNATETFFKGSDDVKIIGFVVVPLLFILGVFGNILTIIVMLGKRFRTRTSSVILIALAVSDTIFNCSVPFNKKLVRNILGWDVRSLSRFGCSSFYIILKTSKMTSSWLVVLISFERFIAVCFPLKIKIICTMRNTLIEITCLCCSLLIFNGAWDFSNNIVDGVCTTIYASSNALLSETYLHLAVLMNSLLPASIIMVLTAITVTQILRQSKLRRRMTQTYQRTDNTVKMTTMLIGVSISFLVLVTPMGIAHNVSYSMGENIFETNQEGLVLTREITQTLGQLNFSINFLLYVLCSKEFRRRVAKILGVQCKKRHPGPKTGEGTTVQTTNTSANTTSQCHTRPTEMATKQEQEGCEMKKF